ncbi:hypothetical protein SASPL_144620 [Salvia splendens]|uniref:Gnk2-homologous domain-containing protein n=1 Tax=Salvia splendens TaxID=180675 RepID=A0A8X8WFL7_SALSN|nr:hypothetical protein SASPL_144620 [Salvia splendens]
MQSDLLALGQTLCGSNGNYTTNSADLNTALSSLSTNIDNDGFYNASTGQGPNRVNAVALCRGDVQLNACRKPATISWSRARFRREPGGMNSARYDTHETVYGAAANSPRYSFSNVLNVTSPAQFRADLRKLLDDLRGRAAVGSSTRKRRSHHRSIPPQPLD